MQSKKIFLNHKVSQFTESVIRDMTRVCLEVNGINLAQGFPDYDPEPEIKEAAKKAIDDGFNQYAITWGSPNFRKAISKKLTEYNKIPTDPQKNITVTCGSTEAMICALLSIIDAGDEVIIFEPFYENYGPDCILSGAKPVYVSLKEKAGQFCFDEAELTRAFNQKTKAIIINTPNNPLGKIFSKREMELIASLCQEYQVLAITDEIYEYILYDGEKHISIGSLPGMKDLTITISGCSKTYSVTGWRLAYLRASEEITSGLRKVHDFLTVGAPHPLQEAGAFMLSLKNDFYEKLRASFDERRHLLLDILQSAGFKCFFPKGAYYIMTNIDHFYGNKIKNDVEFGMWLAKEIGVAAVPGSSFYHSKQLGSKQIRFTFSKKKETLHQAGERLIKLSSRLPN